MYEHTHKGGERRARERGKKVGNTRVLGKFKQQILSSQHAAAAGARGCILVLLSLASSCSTAHSLIMLGLLIKSYFFFFG